MIIKVCGINSQENYNAISSLEIDMIGLNFYPKSKRYINPQSEINIKKNILNVGVFVNEPMEVLLNIASKYQLDYVQLHGNESPEYCEIIRKSFKIIKAFSIKNKEDLMVTNDYPQAHLFLFDTKTNLYGGSGKKFDWKIIEDYKGDTEFLLAGGIGPMDSSFINDLSHNKFRGIDINSKFEDKPGTKNINMVNQFLEDLKQQHD